MKSLSLLLVAAMGLTIAFSSPLVSSPPEIRGGIRARDPELNRAVLMPAVARIQRRDLSSLNPHTQIELYYEAPADGKSFCFVLLCSNMLFTLGHPEEGCGTWTKYTLEFCKTK
jgi:hypothetical protein